MSEQQPPKVEIVSAEVVTDTPDAIEIDLDVRISKLEGEVEREEQTLGQVTRSVLGLQDASLKHSVALGLFLAVLFFIASKALGA